MSERLRPEVPDRSSTFIGRRFINAEQSQEDGRTFNNVEVGTRWGVIRLQTPSDVLRKEPSPEDKNVDLSLLHETLTYVASKSTPRHSMRDETLHTYTMTFLATNWYWISCLLAVTPEYHAKPELFPEVGLGKYGVADLVGCAPDGSLHIIEVGSFYAKKDEQLARYGEGAHDMIPGVNGNLALTVGRYQPLDHGRRDPRLRVRLEGLPISKEFPANEGQPQQ